MWLHQQLAFFPGAAYRPPGLRTRASVDNCFLESAIDAPAAASAGATANQRSAAPSAPSAAAPADAAATWLADDAAAVTPAAAPQPAELPPTECSGGGSGSSDRVLRRSASRWLQAAHSGSLRMFVEQQLLQRVLTAITVLEWPLTIARRATIPLLEQVRSNHLLLPRKSEECGWSARVLQSHMQQRA